MSGHIDHPDLDDPERPAILVDGCPRCEEHAKSLYDLDEHFTAVLWRKMIAVNHDGTDHLRSYAEKTAVDQLWKFALILERYTQVDPWSLFQAHRPPTDLGALTAAMQRGDVRRIAKVMGVKVEPT